MHKKLLLLSLFVLITDTQTQTVISCKMFKGDKYPVFADGKRREQLPRNVRTKQSKRSNRKNKRSNSKRTKRFDFPQGTVVK